MAVDTFVPNDTKVQRDGKWQCILCGTTYYIFFTRLKYLGKVPPKNIELIEIRKGIFFQEE